MTRLSQRDVGNLFESLRRGAVPHRGLQAYAVGIEAQRAEIARQLDFAEQGDGSIKFLRGAYGCGKTFTSRLAVLDAQSRNFATSFVVVSDSDLRFHRFDDVYRKVLASLATRSCPSGALSDILDRWIGAVEESLIAGGLDEEAADFDDRVREELESRLASTMGRDGGSGDFLRVIQTVFDLKQEGDFAGASALISWLSGSRNVAAGPKRLAGVKGDLSSETALEYLKGVVEIVKAAGYAGLLIVVDEAETILRMRKDYRHKSLNGIRQILDAAPDYDGLLWLVTGTPEFFDSRRGVAGLEPLHDRIAFKSKGGFSSLRQPQLALRPFDAERLRKVALKLRELYPTRHRTRLESRVDEAFIRNLVAAVTEGFSGDVGIVPRQFLREFIEVLDLVDAHEDYIPSEVYAFEPDETVLSPEEAAGRRGGPGTSGDDADDDDMIPEEMVW